MNEEEKRLRKNAAQRKYAKKTNYKADKKSQKENTKKIVIRLNLNTDTDILQKLNEVGNKQGYIKELIRLDMKKRKQ